MGSVRRVRGGLDADGGWIHGQGRWSPNGGCSGGRLVESALQKSCEHTASASFVQQVERLRSSGYPETVLVATAEALLQKIKGKESALQKSCEHTASTSFVQQVERLRSSGYPETVLVATAEALLQKIKGKGNPDCHRRLDSSNLTEHEGNIYCRSCYGKLFGPKGYGYGGGGAGVLSMDTGYKNGTPTSHRTGDEELLPNHQPNGAILWVFTESTSAEGGLQNEAVKQALK
ncbi:hypothetical protein HPB52_023084 [Rhipicephalus sanguineus]|uniref:Uncharacterized protein n=1 Tax=Rhipicephalus sanguineus TaxID=34632 RepID=A0A9D4Q885_RHISA|nr:hypothetical protein HPB52_023084 [Rhipicephalus sanguineus]